MKRIFIFTFIIFLSILNLNSSDLDKIGIPKIIPGEQIIIHKAYTLSYSEQHEQAKWVAYKLTDYMVLNGKFKRTNNFRVDPDVQTGSSTLLDYKGSGFDRGHLAPAGDMKISKDFMSESFFMSNMSPQRPSFNRGIWKRLEQTVRNFAIKNIEIYIVTGPVLNRTDFSSIGINKVSIPNKYYKVILDYKEPEIKGIAFIIPNEKSDIPVQKYTCSIDDVESITGIDFFSALPDDEEEKIESKFDISKWDFKKRSSKTYNKSSMAVRCKGITKSGNRCKRMTTDPSGYCWQHRDQAKPIIFKSKRKNINDPIVYITKSGKKYHRGSCSSLRRSKIPIRLSEAKARGYTPCKRCKPPA